MILRFRWCAVPVLIAAASFEPQTAFARDHHVSSRADFDRAVEGARPGDVIVFADGVRQDVPLHFRAQGEPGRPITFRSATAGGAVFEGASELTIDGEHLVVSGLMFRNNSNVTQIVTPYNVSVASVVTFTTNASHSRLTDTAIRDSAAGVTTYVHLRPGSVSNRVDHCFFSNQGAIGMTFYVEVDPNRPNHHQIDHNYFGDRKPGRGNRWETLRVGHSEQQNFVSATTVAHNYFYRCDGEIECISNKSTGNRYLYNSFVENRGQLTLRHGDRAWIEGNFFFGGDESGSQGVRVSGSDHVIINNYFKGIRDAMRIYNGQSDPEPRGYTAVNNTLVGFNTFEDCARNLVLGVGGTGRTLPPKNLRIIGNLIQAGSGEIIRLQTPETDARYAANILFGAPLGIAIVPGILTDKPALQTDEWGRIFPDAAQMAARLETQHLPEAERDINGLARADRPNIGAIDARSAKPLYPLSPRDVGPRWMSGAR